MTLPVHHHPGRLPERMIPGWHEPMSNEFEDLFERMERLLAAASMPPAMGAETMAWAPMADMRETDDAFVIECELPGVRRDDIDVEVSDHELRVLGQCEMRDREGVLRRSTRRSGRFEYRTMLPAEVRAEDVRAHLSDGILTVTVPKTQNSKPHHIRITAGEQKKK